MNNHPNILDSRCRAAVVDDRTDTSGVSHWWRTGDAPVVVLNGYGVPAGGLGGWRRPAIPPPERKSR